MDLGHGRKTFISEARKEDSFFSCCSSFLGILDRLDSLSFM